MRSPYALHALGILLLACAPAAAAPGDLDPTFGAGGTATFRLGTSTDRAAQVLLQPDGKAILVGSSTVGSDTRLGLARYNTDGTLDTTFGAGGFVRGAPSSGGSGLVQPDGKIVVLHGCPESSVCMTRYFPDGTPDATFNSAPQALGGAPSQLALLPDGRLVGVDSRGRVHRYSADGTPDFAFNDPGSPAFRPYRVTSMALQSDGKVVVVGYTEEPGSPTGQVGRFIARRVLPDGGDDASYAVSVPGVTLSTVAVLQPDGKLLIAGLSLKISPQPVEEGLVVARILPDGSNDPSFGQGGKVTHLVLPDKSFMPTGIVVRPDGRLVLSASRTNYIGNSFQVVQLNANGSLDATFGAGGVSSFDAAGPDDHANAIALQADGKVLVAGDANQRDFAIARLLPNGSRDPGYGVGGIATTDFRGGRKGVLRAVRSDSKGRLVVLADLDEYAYPPFEGGVGLVRLLPDGSPDPAFGSGGMVVASLADAPTSGWYEARARVLAIQPDDRILVAGSAVVGGLQGPTVMRFNADGSVDTAFGGAGRVRLEYSEHKDWAVESLEILEVADTGPAERWFGQILVAGRYAVMVTKPPPFGCCSWESRAFVARLNWNGTRDYTHGTGGMVEFDGLGARASTARRRDGRVIATAVTGGPFSPVRINADGSIDSSFGGGIKPAGTELRTSLATHLEPDQGIVMTGVAMITRPDPCGSGVPAGPQPHAAFARLTAHGMPAPVLPYVESSFGGKYPNVGGVARDAGGRLLLAGSMMAGCAVAKAMPAPKRVAMVARMARSGALDTGFGDGGLVSLGAGLADPASSANDVTVLSDGRIAAAVQYWSGDAQFGVVRLQGGDSAVDRSRPGDVDGDGLPDALEAAQGRDPIFRDNDLFTDARLFAMQQYRDFLGREGDSAGVDFWTAQLAGGAQSRAQMAESFFTSSEFQGLAAPVARLYFAYFLRIPDYGGLNYWLGRFRGGESLQAISDLFAASPEFVATYGALDNAGFVDRVYRNVLGRVPDAGGLAFWRGQLEAGMTRGRMMLEFSESPEYRSLVANEVYVTMLYAGMLRRAPDAGGFAFWVGSMDQGNSGLALIDGFLAAPEYRARFLP